MSFSTAIRKAGDIGRRSLALARAPAGMVEPRAAYPARPHDGVLVLQRGENPSTDYYLRPRLVGQAPPVEFADIRNPPGSSRLLTDPGCAALFVIVCRYVSPRWLEALEQARPRIARFAYFADDDLPAMVANRSLPLPVRGKVAEGFGAHAERLSGLAGEVWLSTDALAQRYPQSRGVVLHPVPEADPPEPSDPDQHLVVYHGTDVHAQEREFALEVARQLRRIGCAAPVEIIGGPALARHCRDLAEVRVAPQLRWPEYLRRSRQQRAAIFLAPLSASQVNAARAPVKAFDAARLGAAGLFADREPFRSFVAEGETGLLLGDDPQAWADAVAGLLDDPDHRRAMAARARRGLIELRQGGASLPPPPIR